MTPAARVQTAIELLDQIFAGAPAEKTLTGWARRSRFAGSKDRAAVRDHVFDALRRRGSAAALGGGQDGRAVLLGVLREDGAEVEALFSGAPYAPAPLSSEEQARLAQAEEPDPVLDFPDWMLPSLRSTFGPAFEVNADLMRRRAPVFVRVNLRKVALDKVVSSLEGEGVRLEAFPDCETAFEVVEGSRRIANSEAYRNGWIELQDASSQMAVAALPLEKGMRVLDFCAGGGGKVLAMAGRCDARYFAHDINANRMRDIPVRAKRASVRVDLITLEKIKKSPAYDLVFCDVPCSGSGTWRRTPDAKWRFSESDLKDLNDVQNDILKTASTFVAEGGTLAYATCSVFAEENQDRVNCFLKANPDWKTAFQKQWVPADGCDGFFLNIFKRLNSE